MLESVVLLNLGSTLAMVGLIWFVQLVHYPLFDLVGSGGFVAYERVHQRRTTWVVAPLMLTEAATAVGLLWFRPPQISLAIAAAGLLLVVLLWASTFLWQVPAHEQLSRAFDPLVHRRLVRSNWLRTAGWSLRGLLVSWMCSQLFA